MADFPLVRPRADLVLDAALHVFDAAGFDAARVEDIAAAAGVSKGAVYLYFESKAALLIALIERHVAPIAAAVDAMVEAGLADPPATLRRVAAELNARLRDPKMVAIPRLVIGVSNRFPEIADTYRTAVIDRARHALSRLIAAGVAQGRLRAADPELVTRALMGGVLLEALRRHVFRDPLGDADAAVHQVEFLLALLETETAG